MTGPPGLVLASASPRRALILEGLGMAFEVVPAEVDESSLPGEEPGPYVERLSRSKAEAVSSRFPARPVLAGDTVVTLRDEILGKPADAGEAVRMLLRLQGRAHEVFSALTAVIPDPSGGPPTVHSGLTVTTVTLRRFDRSTAEAYVRTGEPMDKAGAYGIQGLGAALVERVEGDYYGVVGLPVSLLVRLLEAAGAPYGFPNRAS